MGILKLKKIKRLVGIESKVNLLMDIPSFVNKSRYNPIGNENKYVMIKEIVNIINTNLANFSRMT